MPVVSSGQMVEVCLMEELISIKPVEVDSQSDEYSSWDQPKLEYVLDGMRPSILFDRVKFIHDEKGKQNYREDSEVHP